MRSRSFVIFIARDHEAKIARDRLVQSQDLHPDLVDLEVEPVHLLVVPDDAPGQPESRLTSADTTLPDRLLDESAHHEDLLRQDVQLILEVPLQLLHDSSPPSRSGP